MDPQGSCRGQKAERCCTEYCNSGQASLKDIWEILYPGIGARPTSSQSERQEEREARNTDLFLEPGLERTLQTVKVLGSV